MHQSRIYRLIFLTIPDHHLNSRPASSKDNQFCKVQHALHTEVSAGLMNGLYTSRFLAFCSHSTHLFYRFKLFLNVIQPSLWHPGELIKPVIMRPNDCHVYLQLIFWGHLSKRAEPMLDPHFGASHGSYLRTSGQHILRPSDAHTLSLCLGESPLLSTVVRSWCPTTLRWVLLSWCIYARSSVAASSHLQLWFHRSQYWHKWLTDLRPPIQ